MLGIQDIAALAIAGGALAFVGRVAWRSMRGDGGCGCGHGSCPSARNAASQTDSTGLKRRPLVTLDQVGTPRCSDRTND